MMLVKVFLTNLPDLLTKINADKLSLKGNADLSVVRLSVLS